MISQKIEDDHFLGKLLGKWKIVEMPRKLNIRKDQRIGRNELESRERECIE
jgi:hypothetical protein